MAQIDWDQKKAEILARIDIKSEVEGFGLRLAKSAPSTSGWIPCHNPYTKDRDPSAGVNVGSGPQRGYLVTFNQGQMKTAVSFWDLARDFHSKLSGAEFKEILYHYAEQTGIELSGKIIKIYDYIDDSGALLFQVCRLDPKDFKQRRPDPDNPGEWIWNLKNTRKVLYRLPEISKANQVIIVEGEKDVDRLRSEGFTATTSPGGAGKWQRNYNDYLKGKEIVIFADNDQAGRDHMRAVAHGLWETAKSIRFIDLPGLPEKGDVSDFFEAGHSADELRMLIQSTEPLKERPIPPEPGYTVPKGPDRFFTETGKYRPSLLVDELLKNRDIFYDGHALYEYREEFGYWKQAHDESIGRIIKDMLGYRAESRFIFDALHLLKFETYLSEEERGGSLLINVKNGMLDPKTRQLLPHAKKFYSTIQMPVDFDPAAKCPRFTQFLNEIFHDAPDKAKTIQQFSGYIFCPENVYEKSLFLIGAGANGKTTLINAIENILGARNIAHLELHQLSEKFALINLKDKILNSCAELNTRKRSDFDIFKRITSRDPVSTDVKFKKRQVSFRSCCKTIFAMNDIPKINDLSNGLARRLIIVNFNQTFSEKERDLNLDTQLQQEASGILNWALDGLTEILKEGFIYECEAVQSEKDSFLSEIDSAKSFIEEACQISCSLSIKKVSLLQAYVAFCQSCNLIPLRKREFYRRLKELIPDLDEYKDRGKGGAHCFIGLDLIQDEEQ